VIGDTEPPVSYIAIFLENEDANFRVETHHWDEIDAAYHQYVERRIDRVLTLDSTDGTPLLIAASRIGGVSISSPESRERIRAIEAALKQEAGFAE